MSVNHHLPHVLVLPEDDADRQLVNGFFQHHAFWNRHRHFQVLPEAGGWKKAMELFESDHVQAMERFTKRYLILVIDFDEQEDRLEQVKSCIPKHLMDRVFVIGVWDEPEALRSNLKDSYEKIGQRLATDCWEEADAVWQHPLLRHNAGELERLRKDVRLILFPNSPVAN